MQTLNSWLSRIWTFPEKRRTCEKTALWAQALTSHLESEGATGAGWGGYWDDTEARKKIPNVIIRWPFDFNGFHSLSLLLASTPGAQGAVNGKAITEPWLGGKHTFPRTITFPVTKAGGWEAALGRKVEASALQGSPGVPRTGNSHVSQGNRQKVPPERQGEWWAMSFFRNNFCHCWKWRQPWVTVTSAHRQGLDRDARAFGSTLSFSLV